MKNLSSLKASFFISILFLILSSCLFNKGSNNTEIFMGNNWYLGNKLIFRNDSCVCHTQYDSIKNKTFNLETFPINLTDTCLLFTQYQPQGYYNDDKNFKITHLEKLSNRIRYDLKYINKKPKLILYTDPFPIILNTKSEIALAETNNFKQIKFIIADYSIGDQIDRSLLKTRGIYNYPNYTIEDCEYIDNKDITFKIIGYNTIYSIERKRIEDYRIKEIVDVVSSKLNTKPEYRPMRQWIDDSDYEYEFYRWSGHGVQINLSQSKYVGNESYRTLVGTNDWTLSYDDSYIQAILVETYRNGKPQSSIIN